jgi:hypothetical protein
MLYMNSTIRNKQLYNLLYNIYKAPTDYVAVYSFGMYSGWVCKSAYTTEDFQELQISRLIRIGKAVEVGKRREIALQNIA